MRLSTGCTTQALMPYNPSMCRRSKPFCFVTCVDGTRFRTSRSLVEAGASDLDFKGVVRRKRQYRTTKRNITRACTIYNPANPLNPKPFCFVASVNGACFRTWRRAVEAGELECECRTTKRKCLCRTTHRYAVDLERILFSTRASSFHTLTSHPARQLPLPSSLSETTPNL